MSTLLYHGDCALVGTVAGGDLVAEEYHSDGLLAQHRIRPDGGLVESRVESRDELRAGERFEPFDLPPDAQRVGGAPLDHPLNAIGARYRGLREVDRIGEMVQPLKIMEKMAWIEYIGLDVSPMALLGLAESRVLATCRLPTADATELVCRRLRFAYALPEVRQDDNGEPYDYDTAVCHVLHPYRPADDWTPEPPAVIGAMQQLALRRPQDVMFHQGRQGRVIVAEGGTAAQPARVHIWTGQFDSQADTVEGT